MKHNITQRQGEYLAFILRYTQKNGCAPSYEDIAAHFGTTSPSVNGMVKTLEKNGFISRVPGASRSLRVEVPPEELPDIAFGRRPRACKEPQGPSAVSVPAVVSAAIAVLDSVMPRLLEAGAVDDVAVRAVLEAAGKVKQILLEAGATDDDALAAFRQVAAEAARWRPDGKGLRVPHRVWVKRG